jgi:hypothetical protein
MQLKNANDAHANLELSFGSTAISNFARLSLATWRRVKANFAHVNFIPK